MIKHSEWVTSDYFRAVGLTVTQGRGFTPEDSARSRRVSVINETLAQRYFRGQNPIGRRWGNSSNFASDGIEIVGVVTDARYNDVKAGSIAMSYMPALQSQRYLRSIRGALVWQSSGIGRCGTPDSARDGAASGGWRDRDT